MINNIALTIFIIWVVIWLISIAMTRSFDKRVEKAKALSNSEANS